MRTETSPRSSPPGTFVESQRKKAATAQAPASAAKVASRTGCPMRVAVISDIHANLPALEAAAEAIERESPDEIWCLGDLVGYGAAAERVLRLGAGARRRVCLVGNHDLGRARHARPRRLRRRRGRRRQVGADGARRRRARLPVGACGRARSRDGVGLYHGSPRDPVWEYVLSWEAARDAIHDSGTEVTLVGHSHVPLAIPDGDAAGRRPRPGRDRDRPGRRALAAQPGVGRPAPRRRPRRGLATARPRRRHGRVPAHARTTSRRRRRRSARRGCPTRSPSGSPTACSRQALARLGVGRRPRPAGVSKVMPSRARASATSSRPL